jgi:hypothetical protein
VRRDDLGELLGQAAQLGPDRRMQRTRVHAFRNRRFISATRQTRPRALLRPPRTFRNLPTLSIPFGLWLRNSGAS